LFSWLSYVQTLLSYDLGGGAGDALGSSQMIVSEKVANVSRFYRGARIRKAQMNLADSVEQLVKKQKRRSKRQK
jgi:hypothetical protein